MATTFVSHAFQSTRNNETGSWQSALGSWRDDFIVRKDSSGWRGCLAVESKEPAVSVWP